MSADPEEASFARLTGAYKHYCPEWDWMAIDETWPEFEACTCYEPHVYAETAPKRAGALAEVASAGARDAE